MCIRRVIALAAAGLAGAVLATSASTPVAAATHSVAVPPAATVLAAATAAPLARPACVSYRLEAPYRNYGYDHIVVIRNGCSYAVSCSVTTNVNPKAVGAKVPASATRSVLTFRGSPARTFTASVSCQRD
jgi:hypothetical protein